MNQSKITRLSVLVSAPSAPMADLVAAILRTVGLRDIRIATDAVGTMRELERRDYGVLLLDDTMTGLDSVEFVRRLRACERCRNRHIPIVMTAAAPGASRIAAARDAGVTEFLRKPFAAAHIESRLVSIVTAPREFIAAPGYAGPDRRRRKAGYEGTERRAAGDAA